MLKMDVLYRRCSTCGIERSTQNTYITKKTGRFLGSYCKKCSLEYNKNVRKVCREIYLEIKKDSQ